MNGTTTNVCVVVCITACILAGRANRASACSQWFPGVLATRVSRISGVIQATSRPRYSEFGRRPPVVGAKVEIRLRQDKEYVKPSPDDLPYRAELIRKFEGAIKDFGCGKDVIATAQTNSRGEFAIPNIASGKYCVDITPRHPRRFVGGKFVGGELYATGFLLDIVADAPTHFIADISPKQADCSGGTEVKALASPR